MMRFPAAYRSGRSFLCGAIRGRGRPDPCRPEAGLLRSPRSGGGAAMVAGVLLGAVLAGCGRRQTEEPAPASEPAPLARVGDTILTEADFAFEVQRRQASGRPMGDAESVLQAMIERQAMLRQAAASEAARDPGVQREIENRLLAQWLDRELQAEKDRVTVSDSDLREAYDANRDAWTRPEQVRLAMLYRRLPSRASAEAVESVTAALRQGAANFLADRAAATQGGRVPGFGTIAVDASEDAVSRYRGGDLGWLDTTRRDYRWPVLVVETGFALAVGEISDVLQTDDGLYVVMKTDRRAAQVVPFDEAAVVMRRRLIREKQDVIERDFMKNLLDDTHIEINREKAARLTLPATEDSIRPPVFTPVTERIPER